MPNLCFEHPILNSPYGCPGRRWVPSVSTPKTRGRWAFAEFTEIYRLEADFAAKAAREFNKLISAAVPPVK